MVALPSLLSLHLISAFDGPSIARAKPPEEWLRLVKSWSNGSHDDSRVLCYSFYDSFYEYIRDQIYTCLF